MLVVRVVLSRKSSLTTIAQWHSTDWTGSLVTWRNESHIHWLQLLETCIYTTLQHVGIFHFKSDKYSTSIIVKACIWTMLRERRATCIKRTPRATRFARQKHSPVRSRALP
ncbi:D-tagatose 3-epimerase [Fusarium oxysporum f. sp. albedinis]|nr:D-tagatose 3-epimerase [Fusarium oxysporum f. sp. albedinis]